MPTSIQSTEIVKSAPTIAGDFLIFLSMGIFGTYPLFLRFFPKIPTINFLFFFQIVGALAFFFIILIRHESYAVSLKTKQLLFLLALSAILNDLCYFAAFRLTTVANAALSHQLVSVFLLFLAPYFIKEKSRKSESIALGVSILGVIFLYSKGLTLGNRADLYGISLGILSAFFYSLIIMLYRYLPTCGMTISYINFWRYTLSSVLLLPVVLSFASIKTEELLPLTLFAFLFAVIASGIHNLGLSKSRALHGSIIGKSEPVIAGLYAFIFLAEVPTPTVVLGGLLIVGSSIWLAVKDDGAILD